MPVAHGEGNYEADEETLKRLEGEGRGLYRYCSAAGGVDGGAHIHGAAQSIPRHLSQGGHRLGIMPPSENHPANNHGRNRRPRHMSSHRRRHRWCG